METESAEGSGQETPAEAAARQRKAEMAAARRAAILAQMSAQQKNFIKEHAKLFQETGFITFLRPQFLCIIRCLICLFPISNISLESESAPSGSNLQSSLSGSAMDLSESTTSPVNQAFPICLGPEFSVSPPLPDVSYTCIVCQEEHRQTGEQPAIVLAAFVQLSTVLRWKNNPNISIEDGGLQHPETWPMLVDGGRRIGTHISTCGHVMHFKCWQQHFDSLLGRERRRSYR